MLIVFGGALASSFAWKLQSQHDVVVDDDPVGWGAGGGKAQIRWIGKHKPNEKFISHTFQFIQSFILLITQIEYKIPRVDTIVARMEYEYRSGAEDIRYFYY